MRGELSRLVGSEHVLEGERAAPYDLDAANRRGVRGSARAVVRPGSAEQVAQVLAWCYRHDVPLTARGGGSGMAGGAVATHGGLVCSLERLNRVRELEPALWRILPEAGVRTSEVRRLARENGLMFAPDPGAAEQSQIGGNVATNAGGPHALKYGVTGSWVAGIEAVIAPGELVQLGGWARKDVAGYDLRSLMIGSEGTLGVITAVRLRLLPAPEATLALVLFARDRRAGCEAIMRVFEAGVQAAALDFMDGQTLAIVSRSYPGGVPLDLEGEEGGAAEGVPGEASFALIVELDGSEAEVRTQLRTLLAAVGDAVVEAHAPRQRELWRWRDGFNPAVSAWRGGKVSEDVVFPIERLREGLEGFERIASEHGLRACAWGHGGEGNVHATVLVDPESEEELDAAQAAGEELFGLVVALGGSVAGEHGVGWIKRGLLERQWDARAVELHEQVKLAFDPKGLLNPGTKLARYAARATEDVQARTKGGA